MKFLSVTNQMKATEQYFPVVLYIMLYKVVLTFESVDEILKCDIQMKATEQYFPVSCGAVYYAVQGCSNFLIQMKAFEYNLPVVLFAVLYKGS